MHNYTIEGDIRNKITMYITLLSVGIYIILSLILSFFGIKLLPLNITTANPAFRFIFKLFEIGFIFGPLKYFFDNYLWKTKLMKKIHKIPDFNHIWDGSFESSKVDEYGNNYTGSCKMEIKQTWTKIHIISHFNQSTSYSDDATIKTNCTTGIELKFTYENKAEKTANKNMKAHGGTNILIYNEADNELVGNYYTDKNRETNGFISVSR